MEQNAEMQRYKNACREYLTIVGLTDMQVYGRELGLRRPTAMRKADLIEEILKALCGEEIEGRNQRGAPIKNFSSGKIGENIERLSHSRPN